VTGAVLVGGATSDAGKTVVVAGICRWLHRNGVAVSPFKAQNMSLNAAVTPDGAEIGRAQVMQAAAAGIAPEAAMNPILIKPASERSAQLVVMGRAVPGPDGVLHASSYPGRTAALMPVVLAALEGLRRRFDVVVAEGAGGIAEINLRQGDLANLGLARAAGLPVVVVCDIDRGGAFASAFGSLAILEPADQALVKGFVINRLRGDPALLGPGLAELESRTGRPVLGVLPWVPGLAVDAEDSLALTGRYGPDGGGQPVEPALVVAAVRLPRISNFTDLDPLAAEPGVTVRFTASPEEVWGADLAVVPGTKATTADLTWLRRAGIGEALVRRAQAGRPVLGICGGYQMLGTRIVDTVEGRGGEVPGLGLLPVETVFAEDKVLACPAGTAPRFGGVPVSGYEIHHGRVVSRGQPLFLAARRPLGARSPGEPGAPGAGEPEGCDAGAVLGTSWHGVLECDGFRRSLLGWVAARAGREWQPGERPFAAVREAQLDRLGDLVAGHLDTRALAGIIEGGPGPGPGAGGGLPVLTTALAPPC
jgi:adenosylcobyric acid synthase